MGAAGGGLAKSQAGVVVRDLVHADSLAVGPFSGNVALLCVRDKGRKES